MPNIEYHLYRVKLVKPAQLALFHPEMTPRSIFEDVLSERPSLQFREGTFSISATLNRSHRMAVALRLVGQQNNGREFDSETGNFTELRDDSRPIHLRLFRQQDWSSASANEPKVAAVKSGPKASETFQSYPGGDRARNLRAS